MAQSFAFASGNSCFTNSLVQKHKNSACAEFLDNLLWFMFGIEIPLIYATAECQNLRIRLVPNSWDSYAGFLRHRALLLPSLQL